MTPDFVESFAALDAIPHVDAKFFGRIPGLNVSVERAEAMLRIRPYHLQLLERYGLGHFPMATAEQVHGNRLSLVTSGSTAPATGADGLITDRKGITLGIYVADCAPVWVVARDGSAGALLHSGKKGTELGIVSGAIRALCRLSDLIPNDLVVVVGPCIRPPCYEVDFAAEIRHQALAAGVREIHDQMTCTACHPELYYSYRNELGLTGRMLATLTLLPAA